MKSFKYVLAIIMATLLLVPVGVLADENVPLNGSEKVNVYFFHGDTCPHCQEAEAWFEEISEEHGDKFNVVKYEVWKNQDNSKLMQDVAKFRGENAEYVPYIIIGDKSWNGFSDKLEDELLSKIKSEYEKDPADRYDVMKVMESGEPAKGKYNDILFLVGFVVVIALIVGGVIIARKKAN